MICPACHDTGKRNKYELFIYEDNDLKSLCEFTNHFEIPAALTLAWKGRISVIKVGSMECECGRKVA